MTVPLEGACRKLLINCSSGWCLSSVERLVMLTGVEGGLELQLGNFRALRARVVSSAVWFVADMLKLTIGATQVLACLLEVLGAG